MPLARHASLHGTGVSCRHVRAVTGRECIPLAACLPLRRHAMCVALARRAPVIDVLWSADDMLAAGIAADRASALLSEARLRGEVVSEAPCVEAVSDVAREAERRPVGLVRKRIKAYGASAFEQRHAVCARLLHEHTHASTPARLGCRGLCLLCELASDDELVL